MVSYNWFREEFMYLKYKLAKKMFNKKSSRARDSANWMIKTQAQIVFATLASAITEKVIHKAAHKYPKLGFLEGEKYAKKL